MRGENLFFYQINPFVVNIPYGVSLKVEIRRVGLP